MNTAEYLQRILRETTSNANMSNAVEYAIYVGWLKLSYDFETDKATVQEALPTIVERFSKFSD